MKKLLIGVTSVVAGLTLFATTILAAPQGQNLNASQCNTNSAPVVDITFKVTNDSDSGTLGNVWANDNYNKHVQVWDQGSGNYCATVKYAGQFVTYKGPSPQAVTTSGTVGAGVKGAFEGGYQATFKGVLQSGLKTNGNIGTFDYKCNGTYTCPGAYDWVAAYFGPTADTTFAQPYWSWTYHGGNNGTWVNASTVNLGDITGN